MLSCRRFIPATCGLFRQMLKGSSQRNVQKFVDKESFASSNQLLHNTGALIDVGVLTSPVSSVVNRHERLLN